MTRFTYFSFNPVRQSITVIQGAIKLTTLHSTLQMQHSTSKTLPEVKRSISSTRLSARRDVIPRCVEAAFYSATTRSSCGVEMHTGRVSLLSSPHT